MKDRFVFTLWMLLLAASLCLFPIVVTVWIITSFSATDYCLEKILSVGQPMSSFKKLTLLQKAVGYKEGTINPIALLGLFGEAGEVLDETLIIGDDLHTEYIKNDGINAAKLVDKQKKKIRDEGVSVVVNIPDSSLPNFDIEVADALYYLNAIAIGRSKTLEDYAEMSYQKVSAKTQIDITAK